MSKENPRKIAPYSGGMFQGLANRLKLIFRLMGDPRVSPVLKVIPVASLVYLLFPDLAPGPIDDAAIIWLSTYLFVELCPPEVVQEHIKAIEQVIPGMAHDASNPGYDEIKEEDIMEGEIIGEVKQEK
jgi:hypothetical protein